MISAELNIKFFLLKLKETYQSFEWIVQFKILQWWIDDALLLFTINMSEYPNHI